MSTARCGRGAAAGLHARVTTQRGEDGVSGYGEYPWHVAVLTVDLTYLCAGVLVAPRLALTVAHCVSPLAPGTPLVVRVGDWDLASERELYPAYDVEVVRTLVHPGKGAAGHERRTSGCAWQTGNVARRVCACRIDVIKLD